MCVMTFDGNGPRAEEILTKRNLNGFGVCWESGLHTCFDPGSNELVQPV